MIGTNQSRLLTVVLVIMLFFASNPDQSRAQQTNTGPAPTGRNQTFSLTFKDVDIRVFIQFVAKLTNKTYVVSDKVSGRVTVISPGPVSVAEALRIFESVLEVKGFTTIREGEVVKVVPVREGRWQGGPLIVPGDKAPPGDDQIITQVMTLEHASVDEVKRGIRPLAGLHANIASYPESNTLVLTDVASNVRRLAKIIEALDQPGVRSQIKVVSLQYADAADLADVLTKLFAQEAVGQVKGAPPRLSSRPSLKILADQRTNRLILLGILTDMERALETIKELDRPEPAGQYNIHVIRLKYAVAEEMAEVFTKLTGGGGAQPKLSQQKAKPPGEEQAELLSTEIRIVAEPATNALIISASPKEYKVIESIVAKLDVPRTMVYVEAVILEMSTTKSLEFGVKWSAASATGDALLFGGVGGLPTGGVPKDTGPSPGLNFGVISESITFGGIEIPNLSALVRAVQTDSDVRIVATPQILTADNEEATINVATNLPFVTRVDRGTEAEARTVQVFEYRDVGFSLKVTPRISDDRTVRLSVEAESKAVVSAQTQDAQGNILLAPTTNVRQAKTVVQTRDNEILVMGGLIGQELEAQGDQVPCLGSIPLAGWAFKSTQDKGRRTNLLIFLSPHILANEADAKALSDQKIDEGRKFSPGKRRDLLSPLRPKVEPPEVLKPSESD